LYQNLAVPSLVVGDVVAFVEAFHARTRYRTHFVEEAIRPDYPEGYHELRRFINVPVCDGEIITAVKEIIEHLNADIYECMEPNISVMGGFLPSWMSLLRPGRRVST
jgi:L-alanine-DL-glutamate epimerase-like enolase superfamily enzyme